MSNTPINFNSLVGGTRVNSRGYRQGIYYTASSFEGPGLSEDTRILHTYLKQSPTLLSMCALARKALGLEDPGSLSTSLSMYEDVFETNEGLIGIVGKHDHLVENDDLTDYSKIQSYIATEKPPSKKEVHPSKIT